MSRNTLGRMVRSAIILVVGVSFLALLGWAFDIPLLRSVMTEWISMRIVTALSLLCCAGALLLTHRFPTVPWSQRLCLWLGILVSIVGLLSFLPYIRQLYSGSEPAWVYAPLLREFFSPPARMAPLSGLLFMGMGLVFALLSSSTPRGDAIGHAVALSVAIMSYLVLVGYLFHGDELHTWMHVAVAFNTGIAFFALSIGVLCVRPDTWFTRVLISRAVGGAIARRLLPAVVFGPLLIGWLCFSAERRGVLNVEIGATLAVIANGVVVLLVMWLTARTANATDERRRRTEEELHEQREWLRVTLSSIGDAVMTTDTAGRITFLNPVASELTGWKSEEALGQPVQSIYKIFNEKTHAPAEDIVARVLREGHLVDLSNHTALITRDGREIPIEDSAAPIRGSAGVVSGVVLVFHDVTEKRRSQEALENQRARMRAVLENMPAGLIMCEGEPLRPVLTNPLAEKILGQSAPAEIAKDELASYFQAYRAGTEDFYPMENMPIVRAMSGESAFVDDMEIRRLDGSRVRLEVFGAPVRDFTGRIRAAVAIFRDITKRKQMEEVLRESEEKFRTLFRTSPSPIAITTLKEGCFLDVNDAFTGLTGYTSEEALGKTILELNFFLDPEERARLTRILVEEGRFHDEKVLLRSKSGDKITSLLSAELMEINGALCIVTSAGDITEIEKAQNALRQSHAELEERVRERTAELAASNAELQTYASRLELLNSDLQEFAFVASHDLAEPLRKIQSFGARLRDKCAVSLGEEGCDYLMRMESAAARMQMLLTSLLDYSRVTTRGNPFTKTELTHVLEEVASDLEIVVEKSGGHIDIGALPEIEADSTQMRQLFQNLIGNSLKYQHPDTKPVVRVYAKESSGKALIFVEDNGIGFDEKYVDQIFKPFQRLHGRSSGYEGTGMGLAICRKIVERHGGTITARSTPGKGSTFIVNLPARQSSRG